MIGQSIEIEKDGGGGAGVKNVLKHRQIQQSVFMLDILHLRCAKRTLNKQHVG